MRGLSPQQGSLAERRFLALAIPYIGVSATINYLLWNSPSLRIQALIEEAAIVLTALGGCLFGHRDWRGSAARCVESAKAFSIRTSRPLRSILEGIQRTRIRSRGLVALETISTVNPRLFPVTDF